MTLLLSSTKLSHMCGSNHCEGHVVMKRKVRADTQGGRAPKVVSSAPSKMKGSASNKRRKWHHQKDTQNVVMSSSRWNAKEGKSFMETLSERRRKLTTEKMVNGAQMQGSNQSPRWVTQVKNVPVMKMASSGMHREPMLLHLRKERMSLSHEKANCGTNCRHKL